MWKWQMTYYDTLNTNSTIILAKWIRPSMIRGFTSTSHIPQITQLSKNTLNAALPVYYELPNTPNWLDQQHTNLCIKTHSQQNCPSKDKKRIADAQYTQERNVVLAIKSADCLPILICAKNATEIAAIHAGWRSLGAGIIENTLDYFLNSSETLQAWLGPAICPKHFKVGTNVRDYFLNYAPLEAAFEAKSDQEFQYFLDLKQAARLILKKNGIKLISSSKFCTFCEVPWLFSYRKNKSSERLGTFLWM